ncbi:S-layer homology domain-containing protein, partial [Paenibacillus sepulcri]|nr:S-layer homology domain-containing protein [Paenibacillus sepulcri]
MRRLRMIVLAALILLAYLPPLQAGAAELNTEQKFQFLRDKGIFTGFADGTSRLGDPMSREQFAAVLFRLWELREEPASPVYSDVLKTRWSFGEIQAVTKSGLMKGMGNGKFAPLTNVTVEQLAAVLVRAYGNSSAGS